MIIKKQKKLILTKKMNGDNFKMKMITVHIPESYLIDIEKLIDDGIYPNRSELVRIAVRDLIRMELWRRRTD